jgi:hypothetical protein
MMQKIRWIAASLACAAWSASGLAADTATPQSTTASEASMADVAPAKRVVRDKKTGKLRAPSEDELKEMIAAENAARATQIKTRPPLVVREYPNGMRGAVLGPEYLLTLKAQRRADGTVEVSHDKAGHNHAAPNAQLPTE